MARRKRKLKRPQVLPDPIYGSTLVSKFINRLMLDGKKTKAEAIFYTALDLIKEKMGQDPFEVFQKAISNISPEMEVRSRRVGGASYQIPVEVREERKQTLIFRWLVSISRDRKERGMENKLAGEIMDAFNNAGNCVKKKIDIPWIRLEISESWRISMREKQQQLKEFYFILEKLIKSAKCMKAPLKWIGWSRSGSAVLPLPVRPLLVSGKITGLTLLILLVT